MKHLALPVRWTRHGALLAIIMATTMFAREQRPSFAQTASGPTTNQISGTVPASGGYALVVWSGGTIDALRSTAGSRGCSTNAIWIINASGYVGYLPTAPAFVNQSFVALFPGGIMPQMAVLLDCAKSGPANTSTFSSRSIGACPLFPDDNAWATDISGYPRSTKSDAYMNYIALNGGNRFLHADFGSNPDYGIPYVVVPSSQPTVPVTFDYADESDAGPYPLPANVPIEAGSDRHAIVVREGECKLYELFDLQRTGTAWHAGSGAIFDLRSNALRPDRWTSADAAGLPILPGLARLDEVRAGSINHALRFTLSRTQQAFIHPATHWASSITDTAAPPMGLRLRLKADFELGTYRGQARVVLEALKRYGMFVADNGSDWFISGASDPGWDDRDLDQLKLVPGSVFEVVETGPPVFPVSR